MAALQKTSTFNFSLISAKSTIIIGLSGGPDSVFALHQLVQAREALGLTLLAAHLDHEWRASSQEDVQFCIRLCRSWDVPLVVKKGSELQKDFTNNGSQEDLGRAMRQFFLEEVRQQYQATCIVLAHHQNDQLETFFINLIRGTTITGLGGIPEKNGAYVRPLLNVSKKEILEYLTAQNIAYHTDPTNSSDAYLRNRIRATVIPALLACDSRALPNSIRAVKNLQDTEQFLQKVTATALQKVAHLDNTDKNILDLTKFFELEPYLQYRVLKLWLSAHSKTIRSSQRYLQEIMRFLESPRGGKHLISSTLQLVKKQHVVYLCTTSLTSSSSLT